jgi:hypothetical protein
MEEMYLRNGYEGVIISIVDLSFQAINMHVYKLICCV